MTFEIRLGYHIPGHLPWALLSMTKAGHYTDSGQLRFVIVVGALSSRIPCPSMTKAISRPTSKDKGYNIPAEVCKFLVDTLESHCDFLVE